MKKYSPILMAAALIFFGSTLFSVTPVIASGSGACSGHGGVNCLAGPDSDGSAICNDDWRGSSVSYYSLIECQQYRVCARPVASGCVTENDYGILRVRLSGNGLNGSSLAVGYLATCRNQIDRYAADLVAYNNCISPSTISAPIATSVDPNSSCRSKSGIHAIAANQLGSCLCATGYVLNNQQQCIVDNSSQINQAIKSTGGILEGYLTTTSCPDFSDIDYTNRCKCHVGFFAVLDSCVSPSIYCRAKLGDQATWDDYQKVCTCKNGSALDLTTGQCASAIEICQNKLGIQSSVSYSGECSCNPSTEIDSSTGKCESIIVLGRRSSSPTPTISITQSTKVCAAGLHIDAMGINCLTNNDYCSQTAGANSKWNDDLKMCMQPQVQIQTEKKTNFFIGTPKTKSDLLNCSIIGNKSTHLYYLRGSNYVKFANYKGKICFLSEDAAKKAKYKKGIK
jgi:hypothetical protein